MGIIQNRRYRSDDDLGSQVMAVCHSGSALISISLAALRLARLVGPILGWVTARAFESRSQHLAI